MTRKYDALDQSLLQWLREHPEGATTSDVIAALSVTCKTSQRHISRRFTLLEDKGVLICTLRGTTRVCTVQPEQLPDVLHRGGLNNQIWRRNIRADVDKGRDRGQVPVANHPSIPATDSNEFETAGGTIERLASPWDQVGPRKRVGPTTFLDYADELD